MRIGIIGAGHAGVEAARILAEAGMEPVLFSAENTLPYFRPRLIALAFGQVEETQILLHDREWYSGKRIGLHTDQAVTGLDAASLRVRTSAGEEPFDALIISTGAGPAMPPFPGDGAERLLPLWTIEDARRILSLTRKGARVALIGGGLIGIEAALRASDAGLEVSVIEKMETLMAANLSRKAGSLLGRLLVKRGVHIYTGQSVQSVSIAGNGVKLALDSGKNIEADFAIVCVGVRRDTAFLRKAGLPGKMGLQVNNMLRVADSPVFAAGDIAEFADGCRGSVLEALAQARVAAGNVIGLLQSKPLQEYTPGPRMISLKYSDVEVRAAGALPGCEHEECMLEGSGEWAHRARIDRNGKLVGVQMVGNSKGFDALIKGM